MAYMYLHFNLSHHKGKGKGKRERARARARARATNLSLSVVHLSDNWTIKKKKKKFYLTIGVFLVKYYKYSLMFQATRIQGFFLP